MGWFKRKFREKRKLPDVLFFFAALLLRTVRFCFYRVRIEDPDNQMPTARGRVAVTWHNRLLFFPAVFPAVLRHRTVAVVSASRDGQYIADLIRQFGIKSARGSSSRAGARAQLESIHALKEGYHVSFTPDGPRGPRYHMSRGPIHLASKMATAVVPVAINASRYWEIRSWDRFQIPKPFSTLTLRIGSAIPVPPDLDEGGIEFYRSLAEEKLNEASEVAPEDMPTEEEIARLRARHKHA